MTDSNAASLWLETCDSIGVSRVHADEMWLELQGRHAEPHRHYHTLTHVAAMLGLLDAHGERLSSPTAVFISAFFHDAVYDPRAADNELQSAELCVAWLNRHVNDDALIAQVRELILATAGHMDAPDGGDIAWFLDADLAILGAVAHDYDAYATAIRREYDFVPEDQYRAGRLAILDGFLQSPRLYRTAVFAERFEGTARENLQREIQSLRG